MRIAITGATGFLGTALTVALRRSGEHEVVALGSKDCDLTDADAVRDYPHECYDWIFHLAAWTQAGDFCLRHPGEQWIINQQINTSVLAWWASRQPQAKLVFMGTSCAYASGGSLAETEYMQGEPIASLY